VEEARASPKVFAKKTVGQVADHVGEVIAKLTKKPAVIGHSFGGLLTQIVAGRGLSAASVAIDPAAERPRFVSLEPPLGLLAHLLLSLHVPDASTRYLVGSLLFADDPTPEADRGGLRGHSQSVETAEP
jgi:pimeloyl-ACP methyl ester carboxylesterase